MNVLVPVSFFIMFPTVVILWLDFAISLLQCCFLVFFIMGDKEDKLFYCYPQIYYQWLYLSHFEFCCKMCDSLYVANNEANCFYQLVSMRQSLFMSPQIKSSALGLQRCFKTSSRFFINWLKSPVDTLYKLNVCNSDLVPSSMAQISEYFSSQLHKTLILLKYGSPQKKKNTHTSLL